ncbi:MAG TPA: hypothetical protein VFK80_01535, partial [Limnochordia bacterium]|nr:hypothetical protein [Limnochordia bacterium]
LRDDAYLIDLVGDDPEDLAKRATVAASSWLSGREPEQVTNGVTRRTRGAENLWASEGELPQRLWLNWPNPIAAGLVELTLDTGLHRELRLSMSEAVAARSVRGPQPETLRDFDVRFFLGERQVAERLVRGNRQRKLRLKLDAPVRCDRIEVVALAAWEVKQARVFEVRVYPG